MNRPTRHVIVAIYRASFTAAPDWQAGPLPICGDTYDRLTVHAGVRRTYFPARTARLLYGSDTVPCRWHTTAHTIPGLEVLGVEALRPDSGPDGLIIVHLRAPDGDPLTALRVLAGRVRTAVFPIDFPAVATIAPGTRPYTIAFTASAHQLPRLYRGRAYRRWSTPDQWLWALASRTNADDFPPDPEADDRVSLRLSADWTAMVLRDGVAFVGIRTDGGATDPYFNHATVYVRSVYLDAMLIALLQHHGIATLEDQLADSADLLTTASMARFERAIAEFRHRLWWQHLSTHGVPNRLLAAYHEQHHLDARFHQIVSEVTDFSQAMRDSDAVHVTSAALLFSLVTVPASVAVAVLQVIGRGSGWIYAVIGVVVVLLTIAMLASRTGRLATGALRRKLAG